MWIRTTTGFVTRTAPSAALEVRDGKELRYQEVKTKNGVRMVERPDFEPMKHAVVLWRSDTPVPIAQGEKPLMDRLLNLMFEALATRRGSFDVNHEIAELARAEHKRARRRRKRKGGGDGTDQPASGI